MDEQDDEYAPQSPDLSAYHSSSYEPQPSHNAYYPQQQPYDHPAYNAPPNFNNDPFSYPTAAHQPYPQTQQYSNMPRNGYSGRPPQQIHENDAAWTPPGKESNRKGKSAQPKIEEDCGKPAPGVEEGIKVATKFPVARIKRIMQADEDVGKVAQVTPTAVCECAPYPCNPALTRLTDILSLPAAKALELFMISVVTKAADEAKAKSSKRVTAAHLKQAVKKDEQLDFLAEIISKVPDAPAPKKDESSEDAREGKRKKGSSSRGGVGTRRRKRADDD
ncbi:MAG: hypothetical protein Q9173_002122 [Seirophora scorigena]